MKIRKLQPAIDMHGDGGGVCDLSHGRTLYDGNDMLSLFFKVNRDFLPIS